MLYLNGLGFFNKRFSYSFRSISSQFVVTLFPLLSLCIVLVADVAHANSTAQQRETATPSIFSHNLQPETVYFRYAEGSLRKTNYTEKWAKRWSKLDGIIVKGLEEEVGNITESAIPKLSYYREQYPKKLMMLHINGGGRNPTFNLKDFDASHFLYYQGTKNLSGIPYSENDTVIKVKDTSNFKLKSGRGKRGVDDLVMTALTSKGKPDWQRYEYLTLKAVNHDDSTITVSRARFGTRPLFLPKNKAYIAVHVGSGPWLKGSNQKVWTYNWSSTAPLGPSGNTLAAILSKELAGYVNQGGDFSMMNGIAFDVLTDRRGNKKRGRTVKMDFNGDGKGNSILTSGVNTWSVGVIDFLSQLREQLEPSKIITSDGHKTDHQRGFGILNGIESEAWPDHYDLEVNHWSDGINRHKYWEMVSREPKFSYVKIEHYYDKKHNIVKLAPNIQRLIIAGTLFSDAVISPANTNLTSKHDNWPEITAGDAKQYHWLGEPKGGLVRVGEHIPVLDLSGAILLSALENASTGLNMKLADKGLELTTKNRNLEFALPISNDNHTGNMFIELTASAEPLAEYPENRARLMQVSTSVNPKRKLMTWLGKESFEAIFYFDQVEKHKSGAESKSVKFSVEGGESVTIESIKVFYESAFGYREYDKGLVIANPSYQAREVDLAKYFSEACFQKLRSKRFPDVYNGQRVEILIKVPPKDAVFLQKCSD